jgi:hypothetical protein
MVLIILLLCAMASKVAFLQRWIRRSFDSIGRFVHRNPGCFVILPCFFALLGYIALTSPALDLARAQSSPTITSPNSERAGESEKLLLRSAIVKTGKNYEAYDRSKAVIGDTELFSSASVLFPTYEAVELDDGKTLR